MIRPFIVRDCYFSSIEAGSVLCLRVGYTTAGVSFGPATMKRRPWWMPRIHLSLWSHTGQAGQRWVFRLQVGRLKVGYRTVGDATPDRASYFDAGWNFH